MLFEISPVKKGIIEERVNSLGSQLYAQCCRCSNYKKPKGVRRKIPHVTLKDIGKEVGVSVVTVSRALNDKPDISYETKQKIREVAERLGYSPNALARSLKAKKTSSIGVLIADIAASVVKGIENAAREMGYNIVFYDISEKYEWEKLAVQMMLGKKTRWIINHSISD